ncbi:MAG: hypothetical protein LAN84_04275 [Acidobacteriia bacterium]|nr:hypothetical protein [Terriglobia bacterium]
MLPTQRIVPGVLESAFRRECEALLTENVLARLWARDSSLWPPSPEKNGAAQEGFSWLDLPVSMGPKLPELAEFSAEIEKDGIRDIVNLGFGISHIAPEVVTRAFPVPAGRRFFALDSTDPASVREVAEAIEIRKTLFLVAGKSGKSLDTHIHFLYFLDRLKSAGVKRPGEHFAAVAEEHSYLDQIARQYGFRKRFLDPPGLGVRYSVFSHFGLVRAALWGLDLPAYLAAGAAMHRACGPDTPPEQNPALALGALLATGVIEGRDKLLLHASPRIAWLSQRIEQLIAAGTGKQGSGIVPVVEDWENDGDSSSTWGITALLRLQEESAPELERRVAGARESEQPFVEILLNSPLEVGAEFYKWEVATTLAAYLLGVAPFEIPAVRESEARTAEMLEGVQTQRGLPAATARVCEAGLELYAEGAARQQISTLSLADALQTCFKLRQPDSYLALLSFLPNNARIEEGLRALRRQLSRTLGIPVLLSFGPRYLYSLGQLYKGGPDTGLFLMLTAAQEQDVPIPGAGYTFGQLQMAQALGDLDSLVRLQRPAIRLHLAQGAEAGMEQLEKAVHRALAQARRA